MLTRVHITVNFQDVKKSSATRYDLRASISVQADAPQPLGK
jgi:hypothetical protein